MDEMNKNKQKQKTIKQTTIKKNKNFKIILLRTLAGYGIIVLRGR